MKRYITLLAVLVITASSVFGQNKVYWVHGYNDNKNTWNTYKNALTPSYLNQGASFTWYSTSSISDAADSLNKYVNSEVKSSNKAIVFGHSAGGLVARKSAQSNNKIRAIITAGTPNQGAGIVTSLRNKTLNSVASTAVSKAQTSLSLGMQSLGSLLPGVGNAICSLISASIDIAGEVAEVVGRDHLDKFVNIEGYTAAASDMNPSPQSVFLKDLNSSTSTIPIINIYGNEDDNRIVRIWGTYDNKKVNDTNTTDQCFDETKFGLYNGILATSTTFEVLHYAVGTAMAVVAIFCPYYWGPSALNFTAAASWTETRRFVQYDIHNEWDNAIGAVHTDTIENWHRFLWWTWCDVEYVTVYEDSDGFIPNKSSKMTGSNVNNIELKGVNHLEMNSHNSMRQQLNDILNRGTRGNAFNYHY